LDIRCGDAEEELRKQPDHSVHCCVTSPPYYNLRDYGIDRQIGQEDTVADYVQSLMAVFRHVKRVLRDDGTLWLNLGDSCKRKDLLFIPERVVMGLQEDGWFVRSKWLWDNGQSGTGTGAAGSFD
jgi:DNA modification methylase